MTKIQSPLMSIDASGSFGALLTFSSRKTGNQVRFQHKQKDVQTAPRDAQREKFLSASVACRFSQFGTYSLGTIVLGLDREAMNIEGETSDLSGYNICIREAIPAFN